MPKTKRRSRKRLIIVSVLVLAVAGWLGYRKFGRAEDVIVVQVEKVKRRDVTETVVANGRIQPVTQVMISPEVAGEIVQLPVKEGDAVKKGDLLVQIKPDNYEASRNSAEANYQFSLGSRDQARSELEKAESDFKRSQELSASKLLSASDFMQAKTSYAVAQKRWENSVHQVDQARFALAKAEDDLSKTTIKSPIDGTVTTLKSQLGERVLGTSFNMGTEMMTIARLDEMEARVDIGEIDIVLIKVGQPVQLEVDAFREQKFKGTVTAIANAARGSSSNAMNAGAASQQEAPKFEVRIRVLDQEAFRPGMSVTAEVETRSRENVLTVPIQSVTTRLPTAGKPGQAPAEKGSQPDPDKMPETKGKSGRDPIKPIEVVFAIESDQAKMIPVETGISDNDFFEIVSGVSEGQEIISGGYKAISRDLVDGKKVKIGPGAVEPAIPAP
ncbi:MAG: efflux RND transporter periplasmic adaptor subunit [Chthoniobacteraceae bacterium]